MRKTIIVVLIILSAVAVLYAEMEMGMGMHDHAPVPYSVEQFTDEMHISRGGQLYDNWWRTKIDIDKPDGDHPLWKTQSTNKRKGYSTYRCKECHGWDYRGKAGAYGKGSHFTGFKGVYAASQTMSIKELEAALRGSTNKGHDFSVYLADNDISDLAMFMKRGVIDLTDFVNSYGVVIKGNENNGGYIFMNKCMTECHGRTGQMINFGDEKKPEFVSTIAKKNLWEFIHKIRSGQPGTRMRSAIILKWSDDDIRDLLVYARILPEEQPKLGWLSRMMQGLGMHRGGGHHKWSIGGEDGRGFGPMEQ